MTSKEKQKELRKIKQTKNWVYMLSKNDEFGYGYNGYCQEKLVENLLRFYKHIDYGILFGALGAYERKVKNTKVKNQKDIEVIKDE